MKGSEEGPIIFLKYETQMPNIYSFHLVGNPEARMLTLFKYETKFKTPFQSLSTPLLTTLNTKLNSNLLNRNGSLSILFSIQAKSLLNTDQRSSTEGYSTQTQIKGHQLKGHHTI